MKGTLFWNNSINTTQHSVLIFLELGKGLNQEKGYCKNNGNNQKEKK